MLTLCLVKGWGEHKVCDSDVEGITLKSLYILFF